MRNNSANEPGLSFVGPTDDMRSVIAEQRLAFVATVCPDGTPNLSPKGTIAAFADQHLVFADIRSPATIRNLERNPYVEINVVDPFCRKGYRFKGKAQIVRDGQLYRDIEGFYAREWVDVGKGRRDLGCFVLVKLQEALPLISPVYDGGADQEQIRREWIMYFASLNNRARQSSAPQG